MFPLPNKNILRQPVGNKNERPFLNAPENIPICLLFTKINADQQNVCLV